MILRVRRRVLHVFARMGRGGAEMRTLDLVREVDRDYFRFDFCTLSARPGELDREVQDLGGTLRPCPLGWSFPLRFLAMLRRGRYDVIHSHVHHFSGAVLRLSAQVGIPVRIAHFRSSGDGRGDGWRRRCQRALMCRWIDRSATHILAVSEAAMEGAWGSAWRTDPRCEVVYNGLPYAPFRGPTERESVRREFGFPHDAFLAIHVGRLATEKNHPRLLAVFERLLAHRADARLLLVGSGEPAAETLVRHEIAQRHLGRRVAMAGDRSDVPRLLKAADVLVFPSLREGLPGAILEACAAGTPVVASDLPAIREIAGELPLLAHLPLSEPDERWVEYVLAAAQAGSCERTRRAAQRAFVNSRFSIDHCVERIWRVWHGQPAAGVGGGDG